MVEENLLKIDDVGDKVGMIWPEQHSGVGGVGVGGRGVGGRGVGVGGVNENMNEMTFESPVIRITVAERAEEQARVALPLTQTEHWLKGDALYFALLKLLHSWAIANPNVCTQFDRMEAQVTDANVGAYDVLLSLRTYNVCEDEMIVYALALLRRFIVRTGLPITDRNHVHVFLACLSLANKTMSDNPFGVVCFDKLARIKNGNFGRYEILLLTHLNWSLEFCDDELELAHSMLLC